MQFEGTHVRQHILDAVEAAVSSVPAIVSSATASSDIEHPESGAIADVSFISEKSRKAAGHGMPHEGVLTRELLVGVVVAAQVPLDMDVKQFEGAVIGDLERAMANNEALAEYADDWFLSETEWNYVQDDNAPIVSAALAFTITYQTPTADPGVAL